MTARSLTSVAWAVGKLQLSDKRLLAALTGVPLGCRWGAAQGAARCRSRCRAGTARVPLGVPRGCRGGAAGVPQRATGVPH